MTGNRTVVYRVVSIAFVLAITEAGAGATTWFLARQGWMASIPTPSTQQRDDYVAHRNPVLGWGPAVDQHGRVVQLKPRHDPGQDAAAAPCVSAYGDSFTGGSEVGDDATYPHDLGDGLGCRVANYGVSGYGSDQALMLVRAQQHLDTAPVVILGHVSENVLRNVNEYRQLLYPGDGDALAFKPRFVVRDGVLVTIPAPVISDEDIDAFERVPDQFLALDAFRGRPRRSFPYSVALDRWLLTDFHVRARLTDAPRHAAFYEKNHPSGALEVTTAILSTFASETIARCRRPVVLLIPVGRDFLFHKKTSTWVDQPLADALAGRGFTVVHAGPLMDARLGGADPCSLFANCSAHFNARGYRLLADVVGDAIRPVAKTAGARPTI